MLAFAADAKVRACSASEASAPVGERPHGRRSHNWLEHIGPILSGGIPYPEDDTAMGVQGERVGDDDVIYFAEEWKAIGEDTDGIDHFPLAVSQRKIEEQQPGVGLRRGQLGQFRFKYGTANNRTAAFSSSSTAKPQ